MFRHYTHAHHITRHITPIHNILSTAPQLNISQKALGTLPEDGNVMPKILGVFVGFHAYINEMHGSRNKIPSKKSRQAALRGGI
jgi:hypothetical protein